MHGSSFEVISIYTVALINIATSIRFVYLIKKRQIQPALAMWIFFSLAIATSLITYLKEGNHGVLENILNSTDLILAGSVTIAILLYGDKSTRFNKFDLICLGLVIVIMIFWFMTGAHFITNLLIQLILVIAYFPVINRMVTKGKNTESFSGWIGMLFAASISLISLEGTLAFIYSYRAIISVTILLSIMLYFEIKNKLHE
jgi:hypothetical protein